MVSAGRRRGQAAVSHIEEIHSSEKIMRQCKASCFGRTFTRHSRLAALGTGREAGSPRSVSRSIRGRSCGGDAGDHWRPTGTRSSAWPLILPALRAPGPHGRSLGERPRHSATPPPAPYLWCRDWGDPEGSCAGATLRAWPQLRRLRSPAHCAGTRSRRLSVRAEDTVARRVPRAGSGEAGRARRGAALARAGSAKVGRARGGGAGARARDGRARRGVGDGGHEKSFPQVSKGKRPGQRVGCEINSSRWYER
jgi:hypothetical protein